MRRTSRGGGAHGRSTAVGLAVTLAALGLACGGEEVAGGRVASMVALPEEPGAGGPTAAAPEIEKIEIAPARAVAGSRVKARAILAGHRAVAAEFTYQWFAGGGRLLGEGPELDTQGLEAGSNVEVVARASVNGQPGEAFHHRFRLVDAAREIGLVVIQARDGKNVGAVLRAVVETNEANAGFVDAEYEWRVAGKVVGSEEELDTADFQPGEVVELSARLEGDGRDALRANPIVLERSAPPEIHSQPMAGIEGGRFRYAVEASSPARGARLRYELAKGPEGMKIDAETGVVSWRPMASQLGRFEVEIAVKDQWGGGVAQSFWIEAEPQLASEALR